MTSLASVPTAIRSGLRSLVLAGAIGLAAGYVLLQHRWSQPQAEASFPVTPEDPTMFESSKVGILRTNPVPDADPFSGLGQRASQPVTIIMGTKSAPMPVFRARTEELVPERERQRGAE